MVWLQHNPLQRSIADILSEALEYKAVTSNARIGELASFDMPAVGQMANDCE
jgi:hypothetical protein